MPALKGCRATFSHVLTLTGIDLASNMVISSIFSSSEKNCIPREMRSSQ